MAKTVKAAGRFVDQAGALIIENLGLIVIVLVLVWFFFWGGRDVITRMLPA